MAKSPADERLKSRLLLCEGPDDREFFLLLLKAWSLPDFRVEYARTKKGDSGGNRKFAKALAGYTPNMPNLAEVLIISDNDENAKVKGRDSFEQIQDDLRKEAGAKFVPASERVRSSSIPSVTVLMVPWDKETGHLEALCWSAIEASNGQLAAKIKNLAALAGGDGWSHCRMTKMLLQTYLAIKCDNPSFTLLDVLRTKKLQALIHIKSAQFKRIAHFIRDHYSSPSPSQTPPPPAPPRQGPNGPTDIKIKKGLRRPRLVKRWKR